MTVSATYSTPSRTPLYSAAESIDVLSSATHSLSSLSDELGLNSPSRLLRAPSPTSIFLQSPLRTEKAPFLNTYDCLATQAGAWQSDYSTRSQAHQLEGAISTVDVFHSALFSSSVSLRAMALMTVHLSSVSQDAAYFLGVRSAYWYGAGRVLEKPCAMRRTS